jgi:hypothetical protein
MILTAYTIFHVIISLVGIFTGFVVVYGLLTSQRLPGWTAVFLATTAATSLTGFFFPFHGVTPAIIVGIISIVILAIAWYARYPKNMQGGWRLAYVITAVLAFYLNFFVLVVQSFLKIPALKAIAPTQDDPPFKLTQLVVLLAFIAVGILSAVKFRIEPRTTAAASTH